MIWEKHVNWIKIISEDDNYKNILQVKIQKEFKTTPTYMVINNGDDDGYTIGVYLSINMPVQYITHENSMHLNNEISFQYIQSYIHQNDKCLFLLGSGVHKIKKKAEQMACNNIIERICK